MKNTEIIFEVTEAEEGGYCAAALGYGIHTQSETLDELRAMVREAVDCYFAQRHYDRTTATLLPTNEQPPKIIRLHFVPSYPHWRSSHEVLAR